jgi:hypothetical protein
MVVITKVSAQSQGICGSVLRELQGGNGSLEYARKFDPWTGEFSRGTLYGEGKVILLSLRIVSEFPARYREMKLDEGELRLAEAVNGCKPGVKCLDTRRAILFIARGIPQEKVPAYTNKVIKEIIFLSHRNSQRVLNVLKNAGTHSPPPLVRRERKLRQPLFVL